MDSISSPRKPDSNQRFVTGMMRGIVVVWIVGAVLSVALAGGVIYTAIHFISKYW